MARGLIGGLLVGGMVSVAGATGVALVVGPPSGPLTMQPVETGAAPQAPQRALVGADSATAVPTVAQTEAPTDPGPSAEAAAAPQATAPTREDGAVLADTQTAARPQTGQPVIGLGAAPDVADSGQVSAAIDPAKAPAPLAVPPVQPMTDAVASVSTAPATLPEALAPEAAAPETVAPETVAPDSEIAAAEAEPAPAVADSLPPIAPEAEPEAAPEVAPVQPIAPAPETGAMAALRPSIGTPAAPLTERAADRAATGLPRVGGATDTPDAAPAGAATSATPGGPPLQRYAAAFENPDAKPLMSIILIDRGDFPAAIDALAAFPYPLSLAIDPAHPDAAAAMARYRAAGFEVLALVDLPQAATASDVEVSLASLEALLPETVAVLEGDSSGLQGSRAVSDQVTAILRDSGRGAVFLPNGLDTARKLASKDGVPAVTVFRDFDSKGQDANVIRRFLDQAAFRAGQEAGGVVMVGRTRPETVSALILWGLADRAGRVALAPISAVLTARQP